MFGKKKENDTPVPVVQPTEVKNTMLVFGPDNITADPKFSSALSAAIAPMQAQITQQVPGTIASATAILTVHARPDTLNQIMDAMIVEREKRKNGTPYLIIALNFDQLGEFGAWLEATSIAEKLQGIRLILTDRPEEIAEKIKDKLEPVRDLSFIKMPTSPELETTSYKYFYTISPQLRDLTRTMRELAENNVNRVYLLGGPGAGKTSLAYYYWFCRKKGNFIAVNLSAESTGDKAAMKSLLCGHVSGAFPGSGSREGALAFAKDGVCFLDESHGVTGIVMQVLMEVLDSGQFMPFGATAKRSLECAVIFASNRSWEALRNMIHLDEHARLGATLLTLTDFSSREEDMIAVLCTTLARFKKQYTSWKAPQGVTRTAWEAIRACPWRGNTRTLIRVLETASVKFCLENSTVGNQPKAFLDKSHIDEGINLWEPAEHESLSVYTSFK